MRILTHLILMIAAVLLPVLAFAGVLTAMFWHLQREAFDQRFLEGARAMTIALDTEINSSIRVLQGLSLSPELDNGASVRFADTARRMLTAQPSWSMIGVVDAAGHRVFEVGWQSELASNFIDDKTLARVVATRQPCISGILPLDKVHYATVIAVPVLRDGQVKGVLYTGMEQAVWLRFLARYPVATDATVTLLDQYRTIVARTLHNDQWVGKPPSEALYSHVGARVEEAYLAKGLEGQLFYAAHRRSTTWGWTVAIGVPAGEVESALRGSMAAMAGGAALTVILAILLTVVFARRIADPITGLAKSAQALVDGGVTDRRPFGRIREVADVADAFSDAGDLLREREVALSGALDRQRQARTEAEAASRAKDEFLAMLSHELRNPLNAIATALAVLEHGDPESAQRARAVIERQTGQLTSLVDDLLDVARVASGKISLDGRPLDLAALVQRAATAAAAAGRLDQHHLELDCSPAWFVGDEHRCEQIIGNLLENAIKYTPAGGRIRLRVAPDEDSALLEVSDTGVGIAPELLPHVFELFTQGERTLDRAQGGLGLGLTLVRQLVELHHGKVEASSPGSGRGSTFRVSFPAVAPPQPAEPAAPADSAATQPLRIVLVEDNDDGRVSLQMLLSHYGHRVDTAEDGPGGAECIIAAAPDVAIVDIGLPGCDGYEVARRVRAVPEAAGVRLVALTGYGQDRDRVAAEAAGFDSYLVKPVDPAALKRLLAEFTPA